MILLSLVANEPASRDEFKAFKGPGAPGFLKMNDRVSVAESN